LNKLKSINIDVLKSFTILINPFMPHLGQELWSLTGNKSELTFAKWPIYDESLLNPDTIKLAIQINGKRRDEIEVDFNAKETTILKLSKESKKVLNFITDKKIIKEIYVKGRLVNLVVK